MAGGQLYPFEGPSVMPSLESVPFSGKSDEDVKKIIIDALENKNYDWRTIDGIVRENALSKEEVWAVL